MSIMNKYISVIILTSLTMLFIQACSDDDNEEIYPPLITDLVCAEISNSGQISRIILDGGETYMVSQNIMSSKRDTTLRCRCIYTLEQDDITIYSIEHIFSAKPQEHDSSVIDPVRFICAWKTANYLNLSIDIMTSGSETHTFGFRADSITTDNDIKKGYFSLLHKQPENDFMSYFDTKYISMPLHDYTDCDSIIFTLNTFNGIKVLKYANN